MALDLLEARLADTSVHGLALAQVMAAPRRARLNSKTMSPSLERLTTKLDHPKWNEYRAFEHAFGRTRHINDGLKERA